MLRLLMIADDFTGALDTGVQLAAHGIPTQVVVDQADLSACSSTVLVVDTETRHLSAAKAAEAVARLTRSAVENGVGCIYKKTDSAATSAQSLPPCSKQAAHAICPFCRPSRRSDAPQKRASTTSTVCR